MNVQQYDDKFSNFKSVFDNCLEFKKNEYRYVRGSFFQDIG